MGSKWVKVGIEGSKRDHGGVMVGHRGVIGKYLTNIFEPLHISFAIFVDFRPSLRTTFFTFAYLCRF